MDSVPKISLSDCYAHFYSEFIYWRGLKEAGHEKFDSKMVARQVDKFDCLMDLIANLKAHHAKRREGDK